MRVHTCGNHAINLSQFIVSLPYDKRHEYDERSHTLQFYNEMTQKIWEQSLAYIGGKSYFSYHMLMQFLAKEGFLKLISQ